MRYFIAILVLSVFAFGQSYDLPNNDADCPANCRQIPWLAGADSNPTWNSSGLPGGASVPNYPNTYACTGLHPTGSTNDAPAIQTCMNTAHTTYGTAGVVVTIPVGIYLISNVLNIPSYTVLRGAKPIGYGPYLPTADATATTFRIGASSAEIVFGVNDGQGSYGSGYTGSSVAISSGYTKGSTSITMASGTWTGSQFIMVTETPDTFVSSTGSDGACSWCGQNDGTHLMTQIIPYTASGTTLALERPLYYTFKSGLSPSARTVNMVTIGAGLENVRLDGTVTDHNEFIHFGEAAWCWVKGIEAYYTGTYAKSSTINLSLSYGAEIRDNYFHGTRSTNDSDENYGIAFLFPNSDAKVENNILRGQRHSTDFEGGGSGIAILYNYADDNYEPTDVIGSSRINHGAHPYMNLYEGNIYSSLTADDIWGTSSHIVLFRNWLWGNETANVSPENILPRLMTWYYTPLNIWRINPYFSVVGNVLGAKQAQTGSVMEDTASGNSITYSSYVLTNTTGCANTSNNVIYDIACGYSNPTYDSNTWNTTIKHGNYDYKTNGVAYWDGGSNHTLRSSMYYSSKPAFFQGLAWPPFGPDLTPVVGKLPAREVYLGNSIPSGGGSYAAAGSATLVINTMVGTNKALHQGSSVVLTLNTHSSTLTKSAGSVMTTVH